MAEEVVATCSNPGCDLPGTKQCSACKTTPYCGPICQTADWVHHKEECPGYLRKLGTAHLKKAAVFHRERNWQQSLRYADLALTKLKQLKDRRLETVEIIDNAFGCKFDALQRLDRQREALECIKENYTLWAMNHMRNPKMFDAAFGLIQSCIHNREFEDAALYAHTAHEMVLNDADGIIPSDQRQKLLARGSYWLSHAPTHTTPHHKTPYNTASLFLSNLLSFHAPRFMFSFSPSQHFHVEPCPSLHVLILPISAFPRRAKELCIYCQRKTGLGRLRISFLLPINWARTLCHRKNGARTGAV